MAEIGGHARGGGHYHLGPPNGLAPRMKIVLYYRRRKRRARRSMLARCDFVLKVRAFCGSRMTGETRQLKVTTKRKYVLQPLETLVCFVSYSYSGSCSGFDASILDPVKKSFYFAHA